METTIKSLPSTEKVYVRFVNKTARLADVYWVDFQGMPVKYHTLGPDTYIDIDTFISHPWVFEDHNTRDKLAVNHEFYFFPPSWKEIFLKKLFLKAPANMPPHRIIVMITLPVYSLRERSLQIVRDHCINLTINPDILTQLEKQLPKSVLDDLIMTLLKKDGVYIG